MYKITFFHMYTTIPFYLLFSNYVYYFLSKITEQLFCFVLKGHLMYREGIATFDRIFRPVKISDDT